MRDMASLMVFSAFVGTGILLWRHATPHHHRQRVNWFLGTVMIASFGAGLTQRDLWPFSSWPLVAGTLSDHVTFGRLLAVDDRGIEHDVDFRAWQPVAFDELMSWLNAVYPTLGADAQRQAAAELLRLAESARARARAAGGIRAPGGAFGPAAAPFFILHPRRWDDAAAVPAERFVALRYIREGWSLSGRAVGRSEPTRTLIFEFPGP